jgi:DNA-binding transcriptional ArsR family regulator
LPDQTDTVFSALADPTRRTLLQQISMMGTATATELAEDLPVSRQAVVKHLTTLNAAGLVTSERVGREVRFTVTPAPMAGAIEWMASVGAEWDERLKRLRAEF